MIFKMIAISIISINILFAKTEKKEKMIGIQYFVEVFGHLHQNANKYSSSLTTISCGYPVKIIESPFIVTPANWLYGQVGDQKGFIQSDHLSEKKQDCFQGEYSKFFNSLNLDLAEMYYWGRLYDLYSRGESQVK